VNEKELNRENTVKQTEQQRGMKRETEEMREEKWEA
jgi:hypothetical protein